MLYFVPRRKIAAYHIAYIRIITPLSLFIILCIKIEHNRTYLVIKCIQLSVVSYIACHTRYMYRIVVFPVKSCRIYCTTWYCVESYLPFSTGSKTRQKPPIRSFFFVKISGTFIHHTKLSFGNQKSRYE